MPAPPIALTRGAVTYTMGILIKDGWKIQGTVSQPELEADWTMNVSILKSDLAVIDDNDEAATFPPNSQKVPFNEAPGEDAIKAKMQIFVDYVWDKVIPKRAVP